MQHDDSYYDFYSIASNATKLWLPEAAQAGGGARGAGGGGKAATSTQLFMLDVPTGGARSARSTSGSTISLTSLQSRIATLESEATARSTPLFRECVELYYVLRRRTDEEIADGWTHLSRDRYKIASGLPAGVLLDEYSPWDRERIGREWYEGPDRNVMAFNITNHSVYTDAGTLQLVTARPLPAGAYVFNPNFLGDIQISCDKDWSFMTNRRQITLTVEHPAGVRHIDHEAFFDPVDIGTAVGADATNGVLKPAAFTHDGTTTTISSLKWENGTVTLGASPTTTMVGHAVDFIDVTGTTTLSLTSDNASTTPLTWTVPDKPWSDGDLLMLRIRELPPPNPVTVTLTPRPEGSFTFFNVTVNWDDPQTCDGQYFVYIGTGSSLVRNMGFHASTVSSASASTGWLYNNVPDFWAVVRCDPSDYTASREVGRVSLRAAVE